LKTMLVLSLLTVFCVFGCGTAFIVEREYASSTSCSGQPTIMIVLPETCGPHGNFSSTILCDNGVPVESICTDLACKTSCANIPVPTSCIPSNSTAGAVDLSCTSASLSSFPPGLIATYDYQSHNCTGDWSVLELISPEFCGPNQNGTAFERLECDATSATVFQCADSACTQNCTILETLAIPFCFSGSSSSASIGCTSGSEIGGSKKGPFKGKGKTLGKDQSKKFGKNGVSNSIVELGRVETDNNSNSKVLGGIVTTGIVSIGAAAIGLFWRRRRVNGERTPLLI